MTYIIGTNFIIQQNIIKPGFTGSGQKNRVVGNYLPPGKYTINYIKKNVDGTVTYTFQNDNLQQQDVTFQNIGQAEAYISSARNEQIPNYELVYKNLS